ncbi:MAG TPA: Hsp20/alpha crystallin family protein, partial [Candidatus Polarisedimenticolaceae bacterium]|nr:Hsp20/alpha crystallin family protein [Candidatus Polarisedimenticolaceae bacterium]
MKRGENDPLQELAGVQHRMNRLFESALARRDFEDEGGFGAWSPVSDVVETADSLQFWLEVPGLDLHHLDVRIDGDELLVVGQLPPDREERGEQYHRVERSSGRFSRRFPLPQEVDRASIDAKYREGVLRITVAKRSLER